ncbi:MAG: suppressor of tub2 mutation, partial [Cyphobasidiales sp. Tagirdzhanova-0007]
MPSRRPATPARSYPPSTRSPPSQTMPPSPTLLAMAQADDYSTFEGYTLDIANTVPLPHEASSDDESGDTPSWRSPDRTAIVSAESQQAVPEHGWASNDTSNLLDHLMDASMVSSDDHGCEVEEAVKGRADQAEQTAHRFLELVEPDDSAATVVQQSLPLAPIPSSNGHASASNGKGEEHHQESVTPLLRRMQAVHLDDSPQVSKEGLRRGIPVEDSWWLTKANMLVSRAFPFQPSAEVPAEVLIIVTTLDSSHAASSSILRLARFSADNIYDDSDSTSSLWQHDKLFSRINLKEHGRSEPSMILLKNLVTHQNGLLGGRELEVFDLLLELRRRASKMTAAASQVVMHLFVERIEPLYALSGIRTSLESYLRRRAGPGRLDEGTAFAYGMALKAVGTLFGHLPSEVLEEELEQVRGLIKEALNNKEYPHLRQSAVSALVKAHAVLQDDTRASDLKKRSLTMETTSTLEGEDMPTFLKADIDDGNGSFEGRDYEDEARSVASEDWADSKKHSSLPVLGCGGADKKRKIPEPGLLDPHWFPEKSRATSPAGSSRWSEDGTYFIIYDKEATMEHIIVKLFNQKSYASFARQLNIYGWRRLQTSPDGRINAAESHITMWQHPEVTCNTSDEGLKSVKRNAQDKNRRSSKTSDDTPDIEMAREARNDVNGTTFSQALAARAGALPAAVGGHAHQSSSLKITFPPRSVDHALPVYVPPNASEFALPPHMKATSLAIRKSHENLAVAENMTRPTLPLPARFSARRKGGSRRPHGKAASSPSPALSESSSDGD